MGLRRTKAGCVRGHQGCDAHSDRSVGEFAHAIVQLASFPCLVNGRSAPTEQICGNETPLGRWSGRSGRRETGAGADSESWEVAAMTGFLTALIVPSGFPPHGHFGAWTVVEDWLHTRLGLGIWSVFLAISCILVYFALRRRHLSLEAGLRQAREELEERVQQRT